MIGVFDMDRLCSRKRIHLDGEKKGRGGAQVLRLAFGVVALSESGAITSSGGLGLLIAVSFLSVLLGWIPGTAKKAWSGPRAEL